MHLLLSCFSFPLFEKKAERSYKLPEQPVLELAHTLDLAGLWCDNVGQHTSCNQGPCVFGQDALDRILVSGDEPFLPDATERIHGVVLVLGDVDHIFQVDVSDGAADVFVVLGLLEDAEQPLALGGLLAHLVEDAHAGSGAAVVAEVIEAAL